MIDTFATVRVEVVAVLLVAIGIQTVRSALTLFQYIVAMGLMLSVAIIDVANAQYAWLAAGLALATVGIPWPRNRVSPGIGMSAAFVLLSGYALWVAVRNELSDQLGNDIPENVR